MMWLGILIDHFKVMRSYDVVMGNFNDHHFRVLRSGCVVVMEFV